TLSATPRKVPAAHDTVVLADLPENPVLSSSPIPQLLPLRTEHTPKLPEHFVQIGFACLMYSALYAISLLVETAYAFERYRDSLGRAAPAIFLWILSTSVGALWSDWKLTQKGDSHALTVAVLILTAS